MGEAAEVMGRKIAAFNAHDAKEYEMAAIDGDATTGMGPNDAREHSLTSRFAEMARRYGTRPAVVDDRATLTYEALWARASGIAARLSDGVPGGDVGVALPHGCELVAVLLGVLMARKAYVPIDVTAPEERVRFMAEQLPSLPLVAAADALPGLQSVRRIEAAELTGGVHAHPAGPISVPGPDDPAYVIFTSGSTGVPKGIRVSHRNVASFIENTMPIHPLGPGDVTCMFHSVAFDFSVWEIFGALLQGATVAIPDRKLARSPADFAEFLCRHEVTVLSQTPSAFTQLLKVLTGEHRDRMAVRHVILGGEALRFRSLVPWFDLMGDRARVFNIYGPTETTVWVTCKEITEAMAATETDSVLGQPLVEGTVTIVDEYLDAVAPGVAGEILIGGAQVSLGYADQPELTAERFVGPTVGGQRAYRTGDLGALRHDGELIYLGRTDNQVQVRGHRVELGEIEAVLLALPWVCECTVRLEATQNEERLVAYLVGAGPEREAEVREALRSRLPGYMMPSPMVWLPALPLTVNGKVDTSALPPLVAKLVAGRGPEDPPSPRDEGTVEDQVAEIWAEVIGIGTVGRDENFFDAGGTSMHVVDVYSRLVDRFEVEDLSMIDLFEFTTIRMLAEHIEALRVGSSAGAVA
jgi:amino acid adenylation domain-containing protein